MSVLDLAHAGRPFEGASHLLFASDDLDETRARVGRVMKPHALGVVGAGQRLRSRMHHVGFGEVSLSRLRYGAAVEIVPDRLESFFLVQMPLRGVASISVGNHHVDSTPRLASVLSPSVPTRMQWQSECDQLMLRLPRSRVERVAAAHLGRELDQPLVFAAGLRWHDEPAWACLMAYLVSCVEQGLDVAGLRLLAAQIEQLAIDTLLAVQPHNHGTSRPTRTARVLPRHVRRVEEYLQAHAQEPVRPEQLAQLAGVSLRSLYAGFEQFCGVSPMHYLRQLRLDRARADLLGAAPAETVAGVALRWGFGHLGRFSADYRQRFGESPAASLRRR